DVWRARGEFDERSGLRIPSRETAGAVMPAAPVVGKVSIEIRIVVRQRMSKRNISSIEALDVAFGEDLEERPCIMNGARHHQSRGIGILDKLSGRLLHPYLANPAVPIDIVADPAGRRRMTATPRCRSRDPTGRQNLFRAVGRHTRDDIIQRVDRTFPDRSRPSFETLLFTTMQTDQLPPDRQ